MPGYRVEIDDAQAHGWRVTLTLPGPAAEQVLSLPVWIPGSYLVREFARHLSHLSAHQGRREVALVQRDKASWVAACRGTAALVVRYRVHAFDASVRGAFLDAERGFFNGSSLFLRAEGREAESHRVQIGRLPAGWQVATAMPSRGPRSFEAADYGELIDHPFALGRFWQGSFEAGGVEHRFVVSCAWPSFDGERLLADVQRLCSTQIRFWHGRGKPPFASYLFMLHVAEDGHGGLEHRASTALAASRRDLPRRGAGAANARGGKMKGALIGVSNDASNGISNGISSDALSDGYLGLLGLISHEYFHAWNVKRLRPREFESLDL